jgi:hypothetical protein
MFLDVKLMLNGSESQVDSPSDERALSSNLWVPFEKARLSMSILADERSPAGATRQPGAVPEGFSDACCDKPERLLKSNFEIAATGIPST